MTNNSNNHGENRRMETDSDAAVMSAESGARSIGSSPGDLWPELARVPAGHRKLGLRMR